MNQIDNWSYQSQMDGLIVLGCSQIDTTGATNGAGTACPSGDLSGVRVTRSLVLYVCFVDRCLSFCTFSFGYCVVCSSSIYGF